MALRTEDAETITSAFEALASLIGDAFRASIARANDAEAKVADLETKAAAADAIIASQADAEARLSAVVDRLNVTYAALKEVVPAA